MGSTHGEKRMTAVEKLRSLLADPEKFIACPGVYDGLTARIALNEGVDCLYMTGAGTTMSRLGMADMGIVTLNDMLTNASMIANIDPSVPLIADADTGFGGAIMVGRTVTQYIRHGIAGLHLEDQVQNKRCGHLNGKQIVDIQEYASRIRAACMARTQSGGDIVIIARTDSLQGYGYDEAIKRMKLAISEGADVAFLEGVTSEEDARRACIDLAPTPCLFNNVPGGVSPDFGVKECKDIGYKLAIFPCLAMEIVYPAVRRAVQQLKETGNVQSQEKDGKRFSPRELFKACGMDELMEFDVKAGGTAFRDGA
ncbi:methylisocitrate lyase-like protein [Plenodomus tracheiphilus IPT5]|uniref:Methylisocitrate lyase-like protein n=1 Tax=Plenodomus tracheiphilus IPT5 TaxID=1408161 RepID=A0A6A7B8E9_9PLEO|nr:methylisocitrate lyase-like protein [Plenodomus tracheiphilus IPT5]